MDSQISDGNEIVFGGIDLCFIHCEAHHCYAFACCEGVVECVTELGAPNRHYYFRYPIQNMLYAMQMT